MLRSLLRGGLAAILVGMGAGTLLWACTSDTFTGTDASAPDAQGDSIISGGDASKSDGGGPPVEAGCANFCATQDAAFCNAFDGVGNDASAGWSNGVTATNGYEVRLATDPTKSCPKSLKIQIPDAGTANGLGLVSHHVDVVNLTDGGLVYSHYVLDFDVLAPPAIALDNFNLGYLRVLSVQTGIVGIQYGNASYQLQVGPSTKPISLPTGQWAHINLDVKYLANNTYEGTMTVDNQASVTLTVPNLAGIPSPAVEPTIGVDCQAQAPAGAAVYYDNVVLHLYP